VCTLVYSSRMAGFKVLDAERNALLAKHPDWRIWYVPNSMDGTVTWCAEPKPTVHAYSPKDLSKDISLAEQDLKERLAGAGERPVG
jgi:hypothetical protein